MYKELIVSYGKTSPDAISSANHRIGAELPDSFVEFALQKDGAVFKNAEIISRKTNSFQNGYEVRRIIPVDEIGNNFVENWSKQLAAFAEDSGGNYFVFTKSAMNPVYFWDHETDEIEAISESFEEFLSLITEMRNDEVPKPVNPRGWINPKFLNKIKSP